MSITVRFTGICTHVTRQGQSIHRVTLVDARNGAFLNGAKIPPHLAKLRINPPNFTVHGGLHGLESTGKEGEWLLRGVYLSLVGATGEKFRTDDTCNLPPLKKTITQEALLVSDEVTLNELAACYFDFERGVMTSGKTEHGAISAVVTVETEAPALLVKCFWNREETRIQLQPGATIEVENIGTQHGDSDQDFLLHYRVFESVPADAYVPSEEIKTAMNKTPGDISVGCSNSQYP